MWTIADINEKPEYLLITDSQDVKAVFDHIGDTNLYEEYQGLFVKLGDGEYLEIWGFSGQVPLLHKLIERLV